MFDDLVFRARNLAGMEAETLGPVYGVAKPVYWCFFQSDDTQVDVTEAFRKGEVLPVPRGPKGFCYIGSTHWFRGLGVRLTEPNPNKASIYMGFGPGFSKKIPDDGTKRGGRALSRDGQVAWGVVRDWPKTLQRLGDEYVSAHWVRLHVSAPLSSDVAGSATPLTMVPQANENERFEVAEAYYLGPCENRRNRDIWVDVTDDELKPLKDVKLEFRAEWKAGEVADRPHFVGRTDDLGWLHWGLRNVPLVYSVHVAGEDEPLVYNLRTDFPWLYCPGSWRPTVGPGMVSFRIAIREK